VLPTTKRGGGVLIQALEWIQLDHFVGIERKLIVENAKRNRLEIKYAANRNLTANR
jgi:hypothetical protein